MSASDSEEAKLMAIRDRAILLQKEYWRPDPEEQARLWARRETLDFKERLRLHHLLAMEVFQHPDIQRAVNEGELEEQDCPDIAARELLARSSAAMLAEGSPARPRHAGIWQGPAEEEREPDIQGVLFNPSLTHLGLLEACRVDEEHMPIALEFVPFDEIQVAMIGGQALLRPCRIFFEYGREDEAFWLPLLYGTSYASRQEMHQDGRITTFIGHLAVAGLELRLGLGVGQQDLIGHAMGDESAGGLFGLGSVGRLEFGLDMGDPRFDEKCRGRGLDPDDIREHFANPPEEPES